MTFTGAASSPLDLAAIRHQVDAVLHDFLSHKARAAAHDGMPSETIEVLRTFLSSGGKRLRPALCVIGWHAAGGRGPLAPVLRAAASLELFHAFALIHDDIMDGSATRRGCPSVHHALAARHAHRADAGRFGVGAAILVGDLALIWADELLHTAGLAPDRLAAALSVVDTMRTEIMYGQYLDLRATGHPTADLDLALTIVRYKTAKYTVERSLQLGAALARADDTMLTACTRYALPVGEAFQLRDDLLGAFGDPAITGKPALDDLRDGKHTPLMALALQRAEPHQAAILRSLVGNPHLDEERATCVRRILTDTGARETVERMIAIRRRAALDALDTVAFPPAPSAALRHLAHSSTVRNT
ncbi:polyprenyl synthetase family protein [Streptomyces sp. NPDC053427]|uniref:polyprenyl synthetase family protein n=1 Tax=Streptomyces sp. NPDC053427 TaxID=3365701 RepID=UPI0037D2AEA9